MKYRNKSGINNLLSKVCEWTVEDDLPGVQRRCFWREAVGEVVLWWTVRADCQAGSDELRSSQHDCVVYRRRVYDCRLTWRSRSHSLNDRTDHGQTSPYRCELWTPRTTPAAHPVTSTALLDACNLQPLDFSTNLLSFPQNCGDRRPKRSITMFVTIINKAKINIRRKDCSSSRGHISFRRQVQQSGRDQK